MEIKVGQIWKENDNRFVRHIKVIAISDNIITVENIDTGRVTHPSSVRFNGKNRGYSLANES